MTDDTDPTPVPEPNPLAETDPVAVLDEPPAEVPPPVEEPDAEPVNDEPQPVVAEAGPEVPDEPVPEPEPDKKNWYIIKVTSGREQSIKEAIERKVRIEGLEEFFGQVYIPVEKVVEVKKVKEKKNGETVTKEKRVTKERKKYPGYVMAHVEFNDRILYLFRETNGVGDFVGGATPTKPPAPMLEIDVKRMLGENVKDDPKAAKKTVVKLDFEKGDRVRIREGAFSNMEGEVKVITDPKDSGETPKVTVEVSIFGRPVPVELDYWQVDKV
jgi:transcriptional antiterminator NusG